MGFCTCGALIVPGAECKNSKMHAAGQAIGIEASLEQAEPEPSDEERMRDEIAGLIFKMYSATRGVRPFNHKTYNTVVSGQREVIAFVSATIPVPSIHKPVSERVQAMNNNRTISERHVSFMGRAGSLCYLLNSDQNLGHRFKCLEPEEREKLKNRVAELRDYVRGKISISRGMSSSLRHAVARTEKYAVNPQDRPVDYVDGNKPYAVRTSERERWDRMLKIREIDTR